MASHGSYHQAVANSASGDRAAVTPDHRRRAADTRSAIGPSTVLLSIAAGRTLANLA
jgi:hypothetical protein